MNNSLIKKPNVIMIMTDDQGYGDLSCMGSPDFITPNIDSLASDGALFRTMYANSPVCSPSRASLLTGKYPGNAGVRAILAGHRKATGLMSETPTIASALKDLGYSTALIGKWHLGLKEGSRPLDNGFDYFYGFMAGCIDYYSHIFYYGMSDGGNDPIHDLWENNEEIYENGEYFTELATKKTVGYIREHAQNDTPFMIYLGYNAPHYPMHAPKEYMDRFAHLPWDRQVMAAMIGGVDDGVGLIVDELKRQGIYENTIIYFQSDNGPSRESRNFMDGCGDPYYGGSQGSFKGHKFSLFEGGIRVPALISYPARIREGQIVDEPVAAMDLFPTILNMAGGNSKDYILDGADLSILLTTGEDSVHDRIFWEMEEQTAVREGNYKLVLNGQLVESEPPQDKVFLSDLENDPCEANNIAEQYPEITENLKSAAMQWRNEVESNWKKKFAGNYKSLA